MLFGVAVTYPVIQSWYQGVIIREKSDYESKKSHTSNARNHVQLDAIM